jgi:hypothetical protein
MRCGMSACRHVGMSACRHVGMSACRHVDMLIVYRSNGSPLPHFRPAPRQQEQRRALVRHSLTGGEIGAGVLAIGQAHEDTEGS